MKVQTNKGIYIFDVKQMKSKWIYCLYPETTIKPNYLKEQFSKEHLVKTSEAYYNYKYMLGKMIKDNDLQ